MVPGRENPGRVPRRPDDPLVPARETGKRSSKRSSRRDASSTTNNDHPVVRTSFCSLARSLARPSSDYCRTQHLHLGFFFRVTISTCEASPGPCAVILATSTVAALDAATLSLTGCWLFAAAALMGVL